MQTPHYDTIITDALAAEWQAAIARLPQEQAEGLRLPLFCIDADLGCWGTWNGGKQRRITLKRALFVRHPWYVVKDVLRHEIAHQLREELYPSANEPPHGPLFRQLCHLIGGRADASGDYPLLDEVVYSDADATDTAARAEGADSAEARLTVKIRKLLSLSGSSNRHEAEAALLKARELAAKYAIDLEADGNADENRAENKYTVTIGTPQRRITFEDTVMGNILQEFFCVMIVWENIPDLEQPGKSLHQLALSGAKKDLRIATYVYDCISAYMRRAQFELPPLLLARTLGSKRALQDFRIGVLQGFRTSLKEQNHRPEMQALVLADKSKLQEYIQWVYPSLRTRRSSHRGIDSGLRGAGETAGRRFILKRGLEKGDGKDNALLKQ